MPNLLLLNDNGEQRNWGAQATPYALRRMLGEAIPGLSIAARSYSWMTRQVRTLRTPFGTWATERPLPGLWRFTRGDDFFPRVADDFDRYADRWLAGRGGPMARDFIAAARAADVVVHNGEHSIYRNTPEGCRALFLLWFARTRLGVPACELNHTAHLTDVVPVMNGMVRRAYPALDAVTVREPWSLRNLAALGYAGAELVPDVVFYLRDEVRRADGAVDAWRARVGLADAPYFCVSGSALPMSAPEPGDPGAVVALVRRLQRLGPRAVVIAKDDHLQFMRDVARLTGAAFFGPEHSLWELWPLLRGARFLVSGHYHYVIMGAMVGCPFVPLSTNSHKMQGVCEHLAWHRTTPYDATGLGEAADRLVDEASWLDRDRDAISAALRARAAELGGQAGRNAELVAAVLGGAAREPRRASPSSARGAVPVAPSAGGAA